MYDSKYDSKMHDIIIPLMGFNGFHHASSTDSKEEFEDFIGRESIIDKLKGWLYDAREDNKRHTTKYSGAYLITGFRGMGKSSFVHKTIHEIQTQKITKKKYVPISINVGNDLLTSRDLLFIICQLLEKSFRRSTRIEAKFNFKYFFFKCKNFFRRLFRFFKNVFTFNIEDVWGSIEYFFCSNFLILVTLLLFGLMYYLINPDLKLTSFSFKDSLNGIITSFVSAISYLYNLIIHKWNNIDTKNCPILSNLWKNIHYRDFLFVITLLLCVYLRRVFHCLYRMTNSSIFITKWHIKRNFRHIIERIESVVTITDEKGIDAAKNSKPLDAIPGIKFLRGRKTVYPIAQTTEIQDLLINQLSLINRLPSSNLRFIFIIDELDKVSPEDSEIQIIPEYEYTNSVKGNSTYRSRQKALAELLANLKYFISSSEAKFVFITGYDMYETTLSDISNREFNIHSIFNGYINVSSFMRKTGKNTSADSMIEEYFTHLILRAKDSEKREDLGDYANFFRQKWEKKNSLSHQGEEYCEMLLERRILFMRHFLTYLFYMSNGSPKKLAMYLEKYVRSKQRVIEQIEMKSQGNPELEYQSVALGVRDFWKKCEWFLYFDERNIQKIEFINYLIYPMIKNLIAKSSIYNDKLLVSTSFMISNLYKFHKSGFSWRNLEYMPELLDINKTPELRDFIGGILQFLNQTHVDDAALNLYKFKFPQRLSEEITFYSKTSEEVSYLFNFSHDELLSIKTLHNKQLDHYNKDAQYESPAIASLHHLLGDIYILEENYEQAIFEYSEALNAISRQIKDNPADKDDVSKILFRIHLSLKLGLAFEKRKTFDTAYITYESIVKMILKLVKNAKPLPHSLINFFWSTTITEHLNSKASLFSNIRLSYLAILAKIAVMEKMDFGGIDDHDLLKLSKEFSMITNRLGDEIKPLAIMDFHNKLGSILYYKNSRNDEKFRKKLQRILHLTYEHDMTKFDSCREETAGPKGVLAPKYSVATENLLTPCTACQYFNKSLTTCMAVLDHSSENPTVNYKDTSKAEFFLKYFHKRELTNKVHQQGNHFLQVMSSSLLGLGNTLLSCAKIKAADLTDFFITLHKICNDLDKGKTGSIKELDKNWLSPFSKSILYYLAAADSYQLLSDYKASYNIYVQILDAVAIYYRVIYKNDIPAGTLDFCEAITRKAIHCAYLHYDSINCAEVDTQKHEFGKNHSDYINLHGLAVFPEIELAIDKYHRICILGEEDVRDKVLKKVLNSRQLGSFKLIATLTQNIQNLSLKVTVNEEILKRILPDLWNSIQALNLDFCKTISLIRGYYKDVESSSVVNKLLNDLDWHIMKDVTDTDEEKFCLLDYLVKDSLYCLSMITELIEPLYSTTLYNHSYIGEFYRKTFYWNHILICIKELFNYTEAQNKEKFLDELKIRYCKTYTPQEQANLESMFKETSDFLKDLDSWKNYCAEGTSRAQYLFDQIAPGSSNLLTSSYLTGMGLDHLDKAIEMHTSGKAYKEMMSTLYFLEDDLQNDTNYMHLAIERFLINHGILRERIVQLRKHAINKSNLVKIDNYVKS